VPFRDAHEMVGQAVQRAAAKGVALESLSLAELNGGAGETITADVYDVLSVEGSVAARDHVGGTAPNQVTAALERARARLSY